MAVRRSLGEGGLCAYHHEMHYVYILRSLSHPDEYYVGLTGDVEARLKNHNAGKSRHTSKHMPWKIISVHGFHDRQKAAAFEKYLKSGSGRAFANRHLK